MKLKSTIHPPKLADRLFEWSCENASIEDLHGDVEELFYADLKEMQAWKAKAKYWQRIISLMLSYSVKKRKKKSSFSTYSNSSNNYTMISHFIKIAFRNLVKNKAFSVINILGLSIAISCCVLLTLFIKDELSYDRHFSHAERIYRLTTMLKTTNGQTSILQRSSPPIGPALLAEYPEIESVTRVVKDLSTAEQLLKYKDQFFYEKRGYKVDSNFFEMFPYEFVEGNSAKALKQPWSIVLSEELAHKIFGNKSALDELISMPTNSDTGVFKVTGVVKRTNLKSHLDADFYMSGLEDELQFYTTWATSNFVFTYLKVKNGTNAQNLIAKFPALMLRKGEKENQAMGRKKILGLQPLLEAHLYSKHFQNDIELGTSGSITYVYITAAIGFLILLLASINFINLTTAKASQRAGEIGIRKAIGAQRMNLFLQFIGESLGIALTSMVVSFLLIYLALPYFNTMVQKDLEINTQNFMFVGEALLAFALITGLVAGAYPSFKLSSLDTVRILKDKKLRLGSSNWIRKGLTAFQFSISIILISSIIIIQQQLHFVQTRPLGFDSLNKVMLPLRTSEATNRYLQFKNEIKNIPGVAQVTACSNSPSTPAVNDWNFYPAGKSENDGVSHYIVYVDEDYFKLMSIPTVEGRDFSFPGDAINGSTPQGRRVIVNRSSLLKMGIDPAKAIGTKVLFATSNTADEIVGVVEDFHQFSLHKPISPMIFYASKDTGVFHQSIIALNAEYNASTIGKIKLAWKKLMPDTPFEYELLSESIQRQYENDQRISTVIAFSTFLAIVISCLGLYGLSIFIAENRTKEISIRKVLGSTVIGIVTLLSKEFLQILLLSFLIAVPISYFVAYEWLKNFACQITLGPGSFLVAGAISFAIVMIVISYESFKAARVNPANSLKSE